MHNADSIIRNITGSNNYVKELEKVCGNIETIDKAWFVNINDANKADDNTIRKTLINTLGRDNNEVKQYFVLSLQTNFSNPFITIIKKSKKSKQPKKTREEIRQELKPKVFIKSDFFKVLKTLEKLTNNLLEAYGHEGEKVEDILKTQPELPDIKNFYGYKLKQATDIKPIVIIHEATHNIINRYMLPMYDMKAIMDKNWGMLAPLFKNNGLTVEGFEVSQHEVKDMLYLFMVAKYRCTITENNKYYVKLFMNIINNSGTMEEETEFGKMDPARFLELLDTINLEAIDKKQKVYRFAEQSKSIIKRIVNKREGENMEDIMADVARIVADANTQQTTNEGHAQQATNEGHDLEHNGEYNDILANV